MNRTSLGVCLFAMGIAAAQAQDGASVASSAVAEAPPVVADDDSGGVPDAFHGLLNRFQFHGAFAQGFVYGSGNNYLTMNTNSGSARWSEGALNLSIPINDNFHVGAQIHSYVMGQIGRGNLQVDWAYADYKVNEWLGFRAGKLKAASGLFSELEGTDTLYNWALLPQGIYEAEYRSFNLPVIGGEIYGAGPLPKLGRISYQLYGGERKVDSSDGSPLDCWELYQINEGKMRGPNYGGKLRWDTPLRGLTTALSYDHTRTYTDKAYFPTYPQYTYFSLDSVIGAEVYSVEYQRGRLDLSAEGRHTALWSSAVQETMPRNAWYVMGSYRLREKLTLGSYFSRIVGVNGDDVFSWSYYQPSNPAFYSNDFVANARYDVNRYVYVKGEGHYIDGELGAFFPASNPNGLQKVTRLAILRVGFTF